MNVTEAIAAAKDYVKKVYAGEDLRHLGLEEVEYDDAAQQWNITLGFSRSWNRPDTGAAGVLQSIGAISPLRRSFKVITIAKTGEVISMKNRPMAEASE